MVKDIICVACPMGCQISVELNDDGEILSVTGNTCKRGDAYARTECTHPERSLTTTVKVSRRRSPRCSRQVRKGCSEGQGQGLRQGDSKA